ncbi:hydroxymethylglutaryl-CoA reductase, degradative [Robiginitalea sp. M366]|uniref:hydroxymethylglutaryl-CoA reductase, degradative n=1 Tax=Robiginitalea aestuariiviva TaxID=3036903 RepID=UPI00240E5D2C|nr:hydroxymethylglutaryl-CoA reductase, degradative [Robiginitalea aestuariiviva]MDG1571875.1 hydroxymethylglutaryl-CoA reductase, degradative [Robiginitalea aestuariiviva]
MIQPVAGFSKRSKEEKIRWIAENYTAHPEQTEAVLRQYWHSDAQLQQLHDEFIENTISNFYLPLGVAPNFLINGKLYAIPMAIEESSVVAAASKAAKYWMERGGFHARVLGIEKIGQVHFTYSGEAETLQAFMEYLRPILLQDAAPITGNMEKRGGGILGLELRDKTADLPGYYQLHCRFDTRDAMGANFINSCLEQFSTTLLREAAAYEGFKGEEKPVEVLMSILSNYTPECVVRAEVRCPASDLEPEAGLSGEAVAERLVQAVEIANCEPFRAVTHNKGIMNGIDAVVIATGNDFRAVEAGVHAYAARDGRYRSLTGASLTDGEFCFWIEVPLALGTVGGLTSLHPLVRLGLEILGQPSARELMEVVAVAGLAQNFAAIRSLVTVGIQRGHMKMHLLNILNQMGATPAEKEAMVEYFKTHTVTHNEVVTQLKALRRQP